MPRYRLTPHDVQGAFSEKGQGEGPELESIDTTSCEDGGEVIYCSGFSAREVAQQRQRESGGTIYVNSVSRRIVRQGYEQATNAPVYYAVAKSPVYTLVRRDGKVCRAYWPSIDE